MLTKFTLHAEFPEIQNHFGAKLNKSGEYSPSYNVCHGDTLPIIVAGHAMQTTIMDATWADTPIPAAGIDGPVVSTKSLEKNPLLKKAFQRKRCIVPATGFFEWKKLSGNINLPFYFRDLNSPLIGFAGIYNIASDENGEEIVFFSIFEVEANELVEPLSDVMPAILDESLFGKWLDPLNSNTDSIISLLKKAPTTSMASFRVGNDINGNEANGKSLIQPVL